MSIITVTRGARSGGVALAEMLAQRLGYRLISREVLVEGARKYNIEVETLQAELEATPSLWQRLTKEHHRYLVLVRCALLQRRWLSLQHGVRQLRVLRPAATAPMRSELRRLGRYLRELPRATHALPDRLDL